MSGGSDLFLAGHWQMAVGERAAFDLEQTVAGVPAHVHLHTGASHARRLLNRVR